MGMRKWKWKWNTRLLVGIGVLLTAVGPLRAAGQIKHQIKDDPIKEVRTRLVPVLADRAYRSAQDSFEARDYPAAERQFGQALELLHSVELPAERPELETLAAGFRALAQLRKAPAEPQRVPESTSIPAAMLPFAGPEPMPPALFTPVPRVYDKTDLDVTPPVEINRTMPPWKPPSPLVVNRTYAGQLQLVIGKDGRVMSAEVLQTSFSTYDWLLLRAVKQWQYGPALKRGVPVEYRQTFEFALRGSNRNSDEPHNLVSAR